MNASIRGAAALAFGLCLVLQNTVEAQLFQRAKSNAPQAKSNGQSVRVITDKQVKQAVAVEREKAQKKKSPQNQQATYDTFQQGAVKSVVAVKSQKAQKEYSLTQQASYNTFEQSALDGMEMIVPGDESMTMGDCSCGPCDSCGLDCCSDCLDCCGPPRSILQRQGQFFFGAEYIYARASFSEALAYVYTDLNQPLNGPQFVEFDFDYTSSYRFYGGYRLCDCDAEIVFNYARYRSDAQFSVDRESANIVINSPYEIDPEIGGTLTGGADVDLNSYDLGVARTIRLGCPLMCCKPCCDTCCEDTCCEDTCCGDGCGNWCPAWDVTWSAGVRFADAEWNRRTSAFDSGETTARESANTRLSFEGVGARIGLLGRRYFGGCGRLSAYARGDISLLVGNMEISTLGSEVGSPDIYLHSNRGRRVIPVTEIEAGLEAHLGSHLHLSSGYFISAWHDLGMRDEYDFNLQLSSYDDANILGFDGLFARAEITY